MFFILFYLFVVLCCILNPYGLAGYCCCCKHSWLLACSYTCTIFFAFALGFSKCSSSSCLSFWESFFFYSIFGGKCLYFCYHADDSTMAEYSFIRYSCMLSRFLFKFLCYFYDMGEKKRKTGKDLWIFVGCFLPTNWV